MKSRICFVANSSATSFIISKWAYPSIFKLAIEMIKNRDYGKEDQKLIRAIRSSEIDADTPISFDTMNHRTFIAIVDGDYHIQTCQNHYFDLEGQTNFNEPVKIENDFYFWYPEYDLFGKVIKTEKEEGEFCPQHFEEMVTLKETGKVVCPKCYWQKHIKFKNISQHEKMSLLKKGMRKLDPELLISLIDKGESEKLWKELEKRIEE